MNEANKLEQNMQWVQERIDILSQLVETPNDQTLKNKLTALDYKIELAAQRELLDTYKGDLAVQKQMITEQVKLVKDNTTKALTVAKKVLKMDLPSEVKTEITNLVSRFKQGSFKDDYERVAKYKKLQQLLNALTK